MVKELSLKASGEEKLRRICQRRVQAREVLHGIGSAHSELGLRNRWQTLSYCYSRFEGAAAGQECIRRRVHSAGELPTSDNYVAGVVIGPLPPVYTSGCLCLVFALL